MRNSLLTPDMTAGFAKCSALGGVEHMLIMCLCMCLAVEVIEHTCLKVICWYALKSSWWMKNLKFPHPSLFCVPHPSLIFQGVAGREPFPLPAVPAPACIDTSESYYEEAQPYGETFNGENSILYFFFFPVPVSQCFTIQLQRISAVALWKRHSCEEESLMFDDDALLFIYIVAVFSNQIQWVVWVLNAMCSVVFFRKPERLSC